MKFKRLLSLGLALSLSLSLAACGGDDKPTGGEEGGKKIFIDWNGQRLGGSADPGRQRQHHPPDRHRVVPQ